MKTSLSIGRLALVTWVFALSLSLSITASIVCTRAVHAQTSELPDFNSIRTPVSPAFTLLGVSPTLVERPNSASDFALSLLDRTQNLARLPKDFALELCPYWLLGMGLDESWTADMTRDPWQSARKTFAVSVGTAEVGTESSPTTALSVGARLALLSGRQSSKSVVAAQGLDQLLAEESRRIADALLVPINNKYTPRLAAAAPNEREAIQKEMELEIAETTRDAESLLERDESAKRRMRLRDDIVSQRPGFWLELAGATSWEADSGIAKHAVPKAKAVWLTGSYAADDASVVVVGRFENPTSAENDEHLDSGLRGIFTHKSWALSAEYIRRTFLDDAAGDDQWRMSGNFDYRLGENLWVNGTFGRDYEDTSAGSLLAQLGVSWQLSRKRYDESQ